MGDETIASVNCFEITNMPLQDITMNQTLPLVNGTSVKSPGKGSWNPGSGTAGPGRTMKEYEDKLCTLQKENFNLKIRIYFLEERMGITSADEDAIKKNIELKVEIESLKKELLEKQELLSQAATAFGVIEEQKEASSRNQAQYQMSLEQERGRIAELEKELQEYRERLSDGSMYYKESFGISPEMAIDNAEKLQQMEELISSLEAEVKQLGSSLEEERNWAQELEIERDQLKGRLESELKIREKLTSEKEQDIDVMREKIKELEEQAFMKDSVAQQYKNELIEKERLIKEKIAILEDKCKAYEELSLVSEKRKKQIDQLRLSVKSRDDALTDLNNKHRALLSQFENGYTKRSSPPLSPSVINSFEDRFSPKNRSPCIQSPTRSTNSSFEWESSSDRCSRLKSPIQSSSFGNSDIDILTKEVKERDRELQRQDTAKKQLILKLCNVQQSAEITDLKLKKLEIEHEKALKMIQGFMERQQQLESKQIKKDRKIMDLELELTRLRGPDKYGKPESFRRNLSNEMSDNPERDHSNQQRFDEMEIKINDLRDQIETIKAEKIRLEKQIQVESEELQEQLQTKEQKIECLECEKNSIKEELHDKMLELSQLKEAFEQASVEFCNSDSSEDKEKLRRELYLKSTELREKNDKIDNLEKELQVKTQNLQKLVNTELWSKNKEIAKLHNHMTSYQIQDKSRRSLDFSLESATSQLSALIKELNDIGISVKFTDDVIQLNYVNGNEPIDVKIMTEYIKKLVTQKNELEKEVDYLKWLKLISKPDIAAEIDGSGSETERVKKYCEVLRMHLKDLVNFMKETLKSTDHSAAIDDEHKKIVLDVLLSSKILSDNFALALEENLVKGGAIDKYDTQKEKIDGVVRKSKSENILNLLKNQGSTPSDSEAFSEPDRAVSLARIGLQDTQQKASLSRPKFSKYTKTFSDSEDSLDYVPYHKTYQNDLNDLDTGHHIQELKETNNLLFTELSALRSDLIAKISFDSTIDEKLAPLITKLEKSQKFCENLQESLEKRINECQNLKRENKQNSLRKSQLEKKLTEIENMAMELKNQKAELLQNKENSERKSSDMIVTLNRENDTLRMKIKRLEEENEGAKVTISNLTKELDHLTLLHSQILVENTKLTNEKLRLEQEVRKSENRYETTVRNLQDKFNKEATDLNEINESHRVRMQELEAANKELRRHVVVCETSDSAPSSSGVSSVPTEIALKQTCDDIIQEYHSYNGSQYWLPLSYPTSIGRSKSSCSPDLGIESDAAMTTMRPLKDTLKITESMTNLLSDDENCNNNQRLRDTRNESPLEIEGGHNYSLDEMETLKQENEALKRRLMKTRKVLEDTFERLSASNKSKKNVEKAITKQLMMTKTILKKTRNYEEPFEN
ncbi:centrosomin-like isoform X3 [Leptopilina boulardi]|uniref:centrosomin-like isoform X3 n=1 Tax=Leptopilina boulardi TaxID=63433 RepID=UPI0021F51F86|nr:centrosomin-like isoform X3 [Leptopilina boulardi]